MNEKASGHLFLTFQSIGLTLPLTAAAGAFFLQIFVFFHFRSFFMEFQGHHQDPAVKRVTDAIAEQSFFVKVLGSYPAAFI